MAGRVRRREPESALAMRGSWIRDRPLRERPGHDVERLVRGSLDGRIRPVPRSVRQRPAGWRALFARGAGLRADLQGLRRVQLRAGLDGPARRPRARSLARLARRQGLPGLDGDRLGPAVRRRDHGDHRVPGGALRARAPGQPGRPDPVHVDHRRDLHDRGRRADAVRLRRLSAAAVSRRRLVSLREQFSGRHPGQQDRRLGRGDRGRAGRGAGAVLPADENRARLARRRRRSRRGAIGRHSARLDLVRGLAGRGSRRARRRDGVGDEARRAVLHHVPGAEGAAGSDHRRLYFGARRHRRRA